MTMWSTSRNRHIKKKAEGTLDPLTTLNKQVPILTRPHPRSSKKSPSPSLRSHPPLELLCQVGYLLVVPLSIWVNQLEGLPWQTYLYLFLFAMQSHIMGEVMDIVPDGKAGRKTTGTVLGTKRTKLLIIGIVMLEVALLFSIYQEYIFGGLLAIGLVWLLLDVFIIYKDKQYTVFEMKLFALMSNVVAVMSMAYVWWSGCLLQIAI